MTNLPPMPSMIAFPTGIFPFYAEPANSSIQQQPLPAHPLSRVEEGNEQGEEEMAEPEWVDKQRQALQPPQQHHSQDIQGNEELWKLPVATVAATTIQSRYRGKLAREQVNSMKHQQLSEAEVV